jgi:sterol-4alpha-carboxylate 3-dehydrogenase (decarboxylating)
VLPPIVTAYRNGQTKFQVGDNENLFDFTYVENVAYGHLLAAKALLATHRMLPTIPLDTERVDGEPFLITNGQPVYFWDFARGVWHAAGDRRQLKEVWKLDRDFAMAVGAILENLFSLMGRKPSLTRQQVRYSTMHKYHNIDKARKRLGYQPLVDLDEGIRRGVQYILDQDEKASQKKGQ